MAKKRKMAEKSGKRQGKKKRAAKPGAEKTPLKKPAKRIKRAAAEAGADDTDKIILDAAPKKPPAKESKDSLQLYFGEIRDEKVLEEKEEKYLVRRAQKGDKACREKMIKSNLKLVVKIAKKYEYFGVPLIDLIEEGNIGLMRALEKFKPQMGFRFSTYATWWIKQSVNRAIANQKNTIRIPVHILDIYHKYLKLIEKELKTSGKYPDKERTAKKLKIEPQKLNEILNIIKSPKSLDLEYEDEDSDPGRTLKDTIEDTTIVKPDDLFFESDNRDKILDMVSALKQNERDVILWRFGLEDDTVLTLEEIGERLKLTRERVRQIETIAIRKLRGLMKRSDDREKR
ncbi:MAG TPA: sigma-70 family RNA polymerase sigma factor [bacterium]|nr:sigma-70 family RNA polymerase sigma factor [bacterium]